MIAISARIELNPDHVEDFMEAVPDVVNETLKEPGCTRYAMARDICEPHAIWISEEWDSEESLNTHLASPHVARFLERLAPLEIRSMEARKYQVSSVGPMEAPQG